MARPSPEQLVEFWNLRTMPTENVRFWQSYVDDKIGPDGKALCSAIVALLVDDPSVFSDMHRSASDLGPIPLGHERVGLRGLS